MYMPTQKRGSQPIHESVQAVLGTMLGEADTELHPTKDEKKQFRGLHKRRQGWEVDYEKSAAKLTAAKAKHKAAKGDADAEKKAAAEVKRLQDLHDVISKEDY